MEMEYIIKCLKLFTNGRQKFDPQKVKDAHRPVLLLQEASVRPDIKHGRVHTDNPGAPLTSGSVLPVLPTQTEFSIPPPSKATIDYDSAFLCSVPLQRLKPHPHTHYEVGGIPEIAAGVSVEMQQSVADQRHLTRVVVGVEEEEEEEEEVDGTGSHDSRASSVDELLQQVTGFRVSLHLPCALL